MAASLGCDSAEGRRLEEWERHLASHTALWMGLLTVWYCGLNI